MGVPVVFHNVADQPHTSSPHFANFPYGLPDHRFMVLFFFTCTSAGSRTHHFIPHQFSHLQTYLHFTYLIQKLTNGAPTLHQFSKTFLPSLGHSFHTGAPVSVFVHFSQVIHYLLYKRLYFQLFAFVITVGDLLSFWPHATHVTLGWSITSHLPSPASSISSEYYPGHLPLPSEFVHLVPPLAQLILGLGVPLTLDLVTRLRPLFVSYILQPRAVLSLPTS
jgi:hypothetical protein